MKDVIIKHYEDKTLGQFLTCKEYSDNESYRGILIELHKNSTIDLVNNISDVLNKSNDHNAFAVMQYLEAIKEISLNYDEVVFIINYLKKICEQKYEYYSLYGLLNDALETKTITELDGLYDNAINRSELYEYTYFILKAYLKIDSSKTYELASKLLSQCNTELFIACSNILFVFDYKNLGFDKLDDVMQLLLQRQANLLSMDKELSQILYIASQIYDAHPQNSEQFFLDVFDYILKFNDEGHLELLDKLRFFRRNMSSNVWGKYSKLILDHPTEKNLMSLLSNNYSFLASESFRLTYIKLIENLLISNKIQDDQLKDFYQMIQYCKLQDALMTRWLCSNQQVLNYFATKIFYGIALDCEAQFDEMLLEEKVDTVVYLNLLDHCCGYFNYYPRIALAFLFSLMQQDMDEKLYNKIVEYIKSTFLLNYPHLTQEFTRKYLTILGDDHCYLNQILDCSQKHITFLKTVENINELEENYNNRLLRRREQDLTMQQSYKLAMKDSFISQICSTSVILYGRGCKQTLMSSVNDETIMQGSSISMELPMLSTLSPIEHNQFMNILRSQHWIKNEINH
ncbi:hypothetical protein [Wohlfahrtiimonas chitiniclastica]|uniref:hypothetical protein n=1 Tax=Wohlfahrtiimonas chitiniclastica TaxID=400946 RepID=UPI0007B69BC7|nr:hypothetical protein [Wohlfahrtiimonas chitiniclastica]KZX38220.1 hypothetical protein A6V30_04890 [Wohlfahrtiimonas chitiniclastica]